MRKNIFLFFLILIFNKSIILATSLEEALNSGYNNDEQLKIIRSDFLNEVEQFPRALAGFMPKISAGVETAESKTSRKSSVPVDARGDIISSRSSRYSKTVTLEQPIFNGGSSVAELKSAQSSFRSSKGSYYAKEQDAFINEINAYLNCVEAIKKYDISKISVKSNQIQLDATIERFNLGESTETDVASAKSSLAAAETNEATAYANLEGAKANFVRIFAMEPINLKMPSLAEGLPTNLEDFTEKSIANNPSLLSLRYLTKASKAAEYARKGALLPQISLRVQNSDNNYSPEDISRSDINNRNLSSTLSVTIPILSRGGVNHSDIRRAKYQTRKNALQLDAQIKQIHSNCKATWETFAAAKARLSATTQGVKSAEIAYEGMVQEEILGSKTVIDVQTSEEKLSRAREARVEAEKALVLVSYQMKSLMGELTAKKMDLDVKYFNPEAEFRKLKLKIIGF